MVGPFIESAVVRCFEAGGGDRYAINSFDFYAMRMRLQCRVNFLSGFEYTVFDVLPGSLGSEDEAFIRVYSDPDVPPGKVMPL